MTNDIPNETVNDYTKPLTLCKGVLKSANVTRQSRTSPGTRTTRQPRTPAYPERRGITSLRATVQLDTIALI